MPPRVATARLQPRRPPASANLPNKAVPCLLASNPSQKLESRSSLKGNPLSDSVSSDSALARLEFGIPVEEVAPAVAQENVESREGRTPRRRNVFLERDDAGQPHLEGGAAHDAVVKRDDVDPVEAYRLDRLLPRPQRQGEVAQRTEIRVEHQRRTVI